jgi:hypothetical protein
MEKEIWRQGTKLQTSHGGPLRSAKDTAPSKACVVAVGLSAKLKTGANINGLFFYRSRKKSCCYFSDSLMVAQQVVAGSRS